MIDGIPLAELTAPTLVGIAVLLLLFGRLIPRAHLQDKADEAERWRLAYEKERDSRIKLDAQTAELLEITKTTHAIISAMFGPGGVRRRGEKP